MRDLLIQRSAVISPDGLYHLILERDLQRERRNTPTGKWGQNKCH